MQGNQLGTKQVIRFGAFEADLHTQELRKHGIPLRLRGQSFQVLQMLLERGGEPRHARGIASRALALRHIWGF